MTTFKWTQYWSTIRSKLEDFSQDFTLYSTRYSYVTNQLEEGIPSDYVTKLTGHAYEVMKRYYERMQMRNLIPEVAKRTYGKKYENPHGSYRLVWLMPKGVRLKTGINDLLENSGSAGI